MSQKSKPKVPEVWTEEMESVLLGYIKEHKWEYYDPEHFQVSKKLKKLKRKSNHFFTKMAQIVGRTDPGSCKSKCQKFEDRIHSFISKQTERHEPVNWDMKPVDFVALSPQAQKSEVLKPVFEESGLLLEKCGTFAGTDSCGTQESMKTVAHRYPPLSSLTYEYGEDGIYLESDTSSCRDDPIPNSSLFPDYKTNSSLSIPHLDENKNMLSNLFRCGDGDHKCHDPNEPKSKTPCVPGADQTLIECRSISNWPKLMELVNSRYYIWPLCERINFDRKFKSVLMAFSRSTVIHTSIN